MSRTGDEHGPLVDLGHERPQVPARARNLSPIVPRASISGRALVAVVAIMTFLASITTGAVLLVSASAASGSRKSRAKSPSRCGRKPGAISTVTQRRHRGAAGASRHHRGPPVQQG